MSTSKYVVAASSLVAIISLVLAGCPSNREPAPIPQGTTCHDAQMNLERMKCDWAVSLRGNTFESVCTRVAESGLDLAPKCVASAHSCEEAKSCKP